MLPPISPFLTDTFAHLLFVARRQHKFPNVQLFSTTKCFTLLPGANFLIAPGARMASTALARCTSCKNSRWQCAASATWQFPVAKCSSSDCEWQMPSDTFREDSQRKRLRTNAHRWSLTVTPRRTFSSDEWQKLECCDDTREKRLSESSDKTRNMSRSGEEEPHHALITLTLI